MLIENGLAHAGMIGNLIHRGGVIASGGEYLKCGTEELGPALIAGKTCLVFRSNLTCSHWPYGTGNLSQGERVT